MSGQAAAEVGISAREGEVLALVGEHLSNAEIGARLFISVRTVETHVSALLRKLGVPDRRALAELAARRSGAEPAGEVPVALPSPLTSFVGRVREQAALADAVQAHRQVTAVGPGGVGKTRLALAVAAAATGEFADGVWFVDLVPVTDPAMVGAAVASALGIGQQLGGGPDESVLAALADRQALLVLDNCEHLRDGVALFVERLLAGCPRMTVLATSRARLLVPFERVFPVPPLSLDGDGGDSDAMALFLERASAVGWPIDAGQRDRVAGICRALDGVALAIELAAARLPTLGLDGLATGLSDHLRLLAGGSRIDDRHRSVRAMLDWSHALLQPDDLTLLRRVAVFVAPFSADAAAAVAGFDPLAPGMVTDGLARLAEQSLLIVVPSTSGTRYRALETIRQYGMERLTEAGDLATTQAQHLRWCQESATELAGGAPATRGWRSGGGDTGPWRARFDAVVDDLRAALSWAAAVPEHRADAYRLALSLAGLAFQRSLLSESQQRYEQAAALTGDPAEEAGALRLSAGAAWARMSGDDILRLYRAAGEVGRRAGAAAGAAADLAAAAQIIYRGPGIISRIPPATETDRLLATARELAGEDPRSNAAVLTAEAFRDSTAETHRETATLAERAAALAAEAGDPVAESAALDALTSIQAGLGELLAAAATARRRTELLGELPLDATTAGELTDVLNMASDTSLGAGDLRAARTWAERLRDLPTLVEEGHLATDRLIVVDALAGQVREALAEGVRFREGWERAGRPRSAYLGSATTALAMVNALAGDDDAAAQWRQLLDDLGVGPERLAGYGATFDAIVHLHRGQPAEALARLAAEPTELRRWINGLWRHWYAALRAEAAVLAGHPDAAGRLAAARSLVAGNPTATAIVDRAQTLAGGDQAGLLTAAAALEAAGCRYQWARTLVLAGGEHRETGAAALAELGITPMRVAG
jgi:predicted ATPase/DNA-binding CsgD family transcriptional regulator